MINLTDPNLAPLVARYREWVEEHNRQKREREHRASESEYEKHQAFLQTFQAWKERNDARQEKLSPLRAYMDSLGLLDRLMWSKETQDTHAAIRRLEAQAMGDPAPRFLSRSFTLEDLSDDVEAIPTYCGFINWCVREGIEVPGVNNS